MRLFGQIIAGLLLFAAALAAYKYRHLMFVKTDTPNASIAPVLEGALSGGDGYILVLDSGGKIYGFGQNKEEQLYFHFSELVKSPKALPVEESAAIPAPTWARVHAGDQASYAISRDGNLWRRPIAPSMRGVKVTPHVKYGEGTYARLFAEESPALKWKKAEQMWGVGSGISSDGKLYFWRESSVREIAKAKRDDPQNQYPQPTPLYGSPQQLTRPTAASDNQWRDFCINIDAIYAVANDGTLWFSGNLSGISNGRIVADESHEAITRLQKVTPQVAAQVTAAPKFNRVFCRANASRVLALDEGNALWGFGNNTFGEVGNGDGDPFKASKKIPREAMQKVTDKRWATIAVAPSSSFGISADGALWAWGSDVDAKNGPTDGNASSAPVLIDNTRKWAAVAATHYSRAALTADGKLLTWGSNQEGALGDGGIAGRRDALTPVDSDVVWKNLSTTTLTK